MSTSPLRDFQTIPPAFSVLTKLCRVLRDDFASVGDVSGLIKVDPGLSSSVVRMSNTAFFAGRCPVTTVDEAIDRLGFTEVFKLVSLAATQVWENHNLTTYSDTTCEAFWEQSLATAIMMEYLAHDVGENPAVCYLLGLVHAVGRFPIAGLLGKVKPAKRAPIKEELAEQIQWERAEAGGIDHVRAGGDLLELWAFPAEIVGPVRHQILPLLAPVAFTRRACMLHLCRLCVPSVLDASAHPFEKAVLPPTVVTRAGTSRNAIQGHLSAVAHWMVSTRNMVSATRASA